MRGLLQPLYECIFNHLASPLNGARRGRGRSGARPVLLKKRPSTTGVRPSRASNSRGARRDKVWNDSPQIGGSSLAPTCGKRFPAPLAGGMPSESPHGDGFTRRVQAPTLDHQREPLDQPLASADWSAIPRTCRARAVASRGCPWSRSGRWPACCSQSPACLFPGGATRGSGGSCCGQQRGAADPRLGVGEGALPARRPQRSRTQRHGVGDLVIADELADAVRKTAAVEDQQPDGRGDHPPVCDARYGQDIAPGPPGLRCRSW